MINLHCPTCGSPDGLGELSKVDNLARVDGYDYTAKEIVYTGSSVTVYDNEEPVMRDGSPVLLCLLCGQECTLDELLENEGMLYDE